MLESLTRIIGDRAVGGLFFGNASVMDFELMGGNARDAIIAEAGKRGMTPFLPPEGAVRLQAMADFDHPRHGPCHSPTCIEFGGLNAVAGVRRWRLCRAGAVRRLRRLPPEWHISARLSRVKTIPLSAP
jgi:hypothetical protein